MNILIGVDTPGPSFVSLLAAFLQKKKRHINSIATFLGVSFKFKMKYSFVVTDHRTLLWLEPDPGVREAGRLHAGRFPGSDIGPRPGGCWPGVASVPHQMGWHRGRSAVEALTAPSMCSP